MIFNDECVFKGENRDRENDVPIKKAIKFH